MHVQVKKSNEYKSRAVIDSVGLKRSNGKQGFRFVDNRPEAISRKEIQGLISGNSQAKKAAQLKFIICNPRTIQMVKGLRARIREKLLKNQRLSARETRKARQFGMQVPANLTADGLAIPQQAQQPQQVQNVNAPAVVPQQPQQGLNVNAPAVVPQQPQQGLNVNAPAFVPQQPQQGLNVNAPAFVPQQPQQGLNVNAPAFVPQQPQQGLIVNAPAFAPQQPQLAPYPNIANGTQVQPGLLAQIINLPQAQGAYQIIGQWHLGFEIWALQHGFNQGMVAHFNVQAPGGPMLHVYYNAAGQLEVVVIGQSPTGY